MGFDYYSRGFEHYLKGFRGVHLLKTKMLAKTYIGPSFDHCYNFAKDVIG